VLNAALLHIDLDMVVNFPGNSILISGNVGSNNLMTTVGHVGVNSVLAH